jgi:hypothetical protein
MNTSQYVHIGVPITLFTEILITYLSHTYAHQYVHCVPITSVTEILIT